MDKPHSGRHCASGVPPGAHCPSLWGQARQGRLPEEKGRAFARPSLCAERKVNTMRDGVCYLSIFAISSATNWTLVPMMTCTVVWDGRMTPATPADLIFFSSTWV